MKIKRRIVLNFKKGIIPRKYEHREILKKLNFKIL